MKPLKFALCLGLLLTTLLVWTPNTNAASASEKQDKKIARFTTKLRKLEDKNAPLPKVKRFSTTLIRLKPKRSQLYIRLAFKKVNENANTERLSKILSRVISRSELSGKEIRKLDRIIEQVEPNPLPTPTPYQA